MRKPFFFFFHDFNLTHSELSLCKWSFCRCSFLFKAHSHVSSLWLRNLISSALKALPQFLILRDYVITIRQEREILQDTGLASSSDIGQSQRHYVTCRRMISITPSDDIRSVNPASSGLPAHRVHCRTPSRVNTFPHWPIF